MITRLEKHVEGGETMSGRLRSTESERFEGQTEESNRTDDVR